MMWKHGVVPLFVAKLDVPVAWPQLAYYRYRYACMYMYTCAAMIDDHQRSMHDQQCMSRQKAFLLISHWKMWGANESPQNGGRPLGGRF